MSTLPPVLRRLAPPVKFKSETSKELAVRVEAEKVPAPAKKMSNKEVALALLVSHVEDSFLRLTDEQMGQVSGVALRGKRPEQVREFYRTKVEKVLAPIKKLLEKRQILDRVTTFVPQ